MCANPCKNELLRDIVPKSARLDITINLKTLVTVPTDLEGLRDKGLEHLKSIPRSDHLIIHWGMATAVYPFWSSVALQVGRLLRLQDCAAAAHVQ